MRGQRWGLAVAAVGVGLAISLIVASYHAPHVTVAAKTQMAKATSASAALVGPGSDAFAGSVEAPSGAHWRQTRERGIERVDLDDGAIRVHVRRQVDGERFLVVLPDGEIEVRGTTFDVNVEHGITTQVDVHEGVVELRIRGRGITRLSTDEAYNAPISTAAIVTAEPTPLAPMTSAPIRIPRRTTHAEDQDIAYAAAVKLLREGRGDEAAAAFHALWLADPHTPQTEDASFLEAVALARQGRVDAAALAAEHHLALFPESFHRKEAAILVARAASQRGDCEKALTMIAPWSNDSLEPNVRGALGPCEGAPR
jgi:hypothetical protein